MKTTATAPYRGYVPDIAYSHEDNCFVGSVPGLNLHGINFDGATEEETLKNFEDAIDFYLEVTEKPETQFAGRLTLQLTQEMHMELSQKAKAAGAESLDAWLVQALKDSVLQHAGSDPY
jgi:predicted HicB family RNase H-like nuclease